MKNRVDIEKLLTWAYREELPKAAPEAGGYGIGFRGGWDAVTAFGELAADVDVNRYGVVSDRGATEAPHPDALIIAEAVAGLEGLVIDMPDGWCPDARLGLGADGPALFAWAMEAAMTRVDGKWRPRRTARQLVEFHAIMGSRPDWRGGPCARDVERNDNGVPRWYRMVIEDRDGVPTPLEVDGFNPSSRRPYANAYRKTVWRPDPLPILVARFEYALWRSALDDLVAVVAGRLVDHVATAAAAPVDPWAGPAAGVRHPRVLRPVHGGSAGAEKTA